MNAPEVKTIAIQLVINPAKNHDDAIKAMREMMSIVEKQSGFVDDVMLENQNPQGKPTHVHVTRWSSIKQWEAVWSQPDFQKSLRKNAEYFTVEAGFFAPMKK